MTGRRVIRLVLGFLGLGLVGCGVYSANTGRVDEGIKRVSVQYLENNTQEPSIGVDLTDAIIRALQVDNTLKVVDESDADTIISGQVQKYRLKEIMARENLTVDEYQVQITVILEMAYRATGEKLFEKKRFSGAGNYVLDDDGETSEETARVEAAAEIVRDVLATIVDDW